MNDSDTLDLDTAIAHLEAVEVLLWEIDADELSQDERNRLAGLLDVCSATLMKLHNADLANLAASFKAREPELLRATAKLEDDLRDLESYVEIIDTASMAMGTITDIVRLIS